LLETLFSLLNLKKDQKTLLETEVYRNSIMIIDLSQEIEPTMQIYPGDPLFTKEQTLTIEKVGCSVQLLHIGTHAGTHIDAPSHFIANGMAVDQLNLSVLVGPAFVVDVTNLQPREEITLKHLENHLPHLSSESSRIVLFRTDWCQYWKTPKYLEHPYLSAAVAEKLMELGAKVIGVDFLNPDKTPLEGAEYGGAPVHHAILGKGGYIVENLKNLARIQSNSYTVSLLPLRVVGGDGCPIRAVAWESNPL
jgi:kynurenine formamidase